MNHTVEALLNSFQVKLDVHLCEFNENLTHLMCLFLIMRFKPSENHENMKLYALEFTYFNRH